MATATKRKPKRNRHMPVSKAKNAYELLGEIRKLILEEPKRYDQRRWLKRGKPSNSMPACGTVGCVAGWVVALKYKSRVSHLEVQDKASGVLGLRYFQAVHLFDGNAADNALKCEEAQTPAHARAGAAHIKKFMEENKEQLKAKAV